MGVGLVFISTGTEHISWDELYHFSDIGSGGSFFFPLDTLLENVKISMKWGMNILPRLTYT